MVWAGPANFRLIGSQREPHDIVKKVGQSRTLQGTWSVEHICPPISFRFCKDLIHLPAHKVNCPAKQP